MQWMIQFVIVLIFVAYTRLAASTYVSTSSTLLSSFGDVRIANGGDSGRLEFRNVDGRWGTVCRNGFDDDAADVACRQLDYVQSDDVYSYTGSSASPPPLLCSASCEGDEDELRECNIVYVVTSGQACSCGGDVVGISCTNSLTAGQIAAVVVSTLVFIGIVTTIIILCICCLTPTCPCYYRGSHSTTRAVVVTTQVPAQTQMVAATDTKTNYQAPPPYDNSY